MSKPRPYVSNEGFRFGIDGPIMVNGVSLLFFFHSDIHGSLACRGHPRFGDGMETNWFIDLMLCVIEDDGLFCKLIISDFFLSG